MTTPKAYQKAVREGRGLPERGSSAAFVFGTHLVNGALELGAGTAGGAAPFGWPSPLYRDRPCAFGEEIVGSDLWSMQREILDALRPPNARVAVRSGHKIGKSRVCGIAGLWFYSSFDEARVVLTAPTDRQVNKILWREVRQLWQRSGRCVACRRSDPKATDPCEHSHPVDGKLGELARSGLVSSDFREIVGFTAREAEDVAGVSGANLFYIIDEASGVGESIFEAIEGNRAGGARILLTGNPTKTEGSHWDAFDTKKHLYVGPSGKSTAFTISSEATPNAVEGRIVIPGLATRHWCEEKREEWGEDSALYKIRVLGEHATKEDGKIFTVALLTDCERRWEDTTGEGRLVVGLDVAGEGGTGDETVFCPRRGWKAAGWHAFRGLDEQGHLVQLRGLLKDYRLDPDKADCELPLVVVDRQGPIGTKVWRALVDFVEANPGEFAVVGVMASNKAEREPQLYATVRDEMWARGRQWARDGGSFPADTKADRELHAPEWVVHLDGKRMKVTPSDELRKILKRSPDRATALLLSTWQTDLPEGTVAEKRVETEPEDAGQPMDPYAGLNAWRTK